MNFCGDEESFFSFFSPNNFKLMCINVINAHSIMKLINKNTTDKYENPEIKKMALDKEWVS